MTDTTDEIINEYKKLCAMEKQRGDFWKREAHKFVFVSILSMGILLLFALKNAIMVTP